MTPTWLSSRYIRYIRYMRRAAQLITPTWLSSVINCHQFSKWRTIDDAHVALKRRAERRGHVPQHRDAREIENLAIGGKDEDPCAEELL